MDFLSKTREVKSPFWRGVLHFLMVVGPGLIVMEADNDAGAVSTYTEAGARYGTRLLWVLLLLLPVTYFAQEMVVRLGIATGRGHAAMIYQRFGKWWGRFSLFDLMLLNFFTQVTEFAAISLALVRVGVSPWVSVPVSAAGLIAMVVTGSYLRWERITIFLCLLDNVWFLFAYESGFRPLESVNALIPGIPPGGVTSDLVFLVIAIVGTTIAPWQLFFQQSAIADKRLRFRDLRSERLDTFLSAVYTILVAAAMMVVGNVLYTHHLRYDDPAQMAEALGPLLGKWLKYGVLLMMVNAAVLGTGAISLASSWAYAEVAELPHSLQMPFSKAKGFYSVYILSIIVAAAIVLIPHAPLQLIIVGVQVLAGLMLPSAIIFLQLLLNDEELLGKRFVNKPWNNWINWTIILLLFALSATLAAQVLLPGLLPQ
jgi:Mn2+/Fe2+ NRAMP family transporter